MYRANFVVSRHEFRHLLTMALSGIYMPNNYIKFCYWVPVKKSHIIIEISISIASCTVTAHINQKKKS